ncbi:mercuric reductase [Mycobacteroides abscessus]|jgi:dihydrolipoamide dehydrogenase|uniref:Mercuric reductase n=13 Tax=Mycobacteriales TaxID=85007 RepID=A0AAE5AGX6_MYCFO|nr:MULTISPECIES: mercuric reductase [Mycobacteriales]ETT24572.1 Dihydrolipoyl dehydrogenase [Rhodococcus rhodochrous ATCC 21198]MCF6391163.1 mercuric reductase [Mycobacterium sp. MBM]MDM2448125.1 mercuric reductase [Mycobacteroides abscessus]MEE3065347.1 mercuric reductase [Actinomycetota bacterium]ANE78252.1 dihydrolipoamide dehydrogenase [Mycobacterium adipatum]
MTERYDTLVLGGGMSGLPLALRAARHGRVAFVEKELLGGTCLNRGCIPTKTMIASAAVAHQARRAAEFGVRVGGPVTVDLAAVVERKNTLVDSIRAGSYRAVEKSADLDFYHAAGQFTGNRRLTVDGTTLTADRIILATGTRTTLPAIDGLDAVPYYTSRTLLDLTELPAHLLVVGGGYVGCEFAQMFRRFGAEVTIVQRADRLLPGEDPDISAAVADGMTADGITVATATTCTHAAGTAGNIRIGCTGTETAEITGSHLLLATGRTPNTDALGLEHLDLQPDPHGFLTVGDTLNTSADNVWAIGDLRGGPMFTHTARDDADIVYRTVYRDQDRTTTGRVVPHAVFTDPEVGAVGLTEPAARAAGYDVIIGRQNFTGVAKARAIGNTRGLVKFVADAATDRILGCHIAGPDGGDLVHEAVIAMTCGATYGQLAAAIHIHPTLAEAVNAAAGGVHRPAAD